MLHALQAYTSLLDACVKAGTPQSLARAFQVRLPVLLSRSVVSDVLLL